MIARLLRIDEWLFRRIGAFRPRLLVRAMRGLTHLGNAESWVLIGLFLLACGGQAARFGLLLGTGAVLATLVGFKTAVALAPVPPPPVILTFGAAV